MGSSQLIGEVLDEKYRIEKELGRGGMGSVYSATHLGTDRPVAVKVIAPQFMRNDEFVERFKREAKAAGRLHHPNVVNVTDFGFARIGTESVAYLVMEFLDGCTLAEVLEEESQLAITWVVDIIEQACSAVDAAHRQGIIHRDLKPDNIWLEPNRRGGYRVKVLDFGLAKLGDPVSAEPEDGSQSDEARSSSRNLTTIEGGDRMTRAASEPRSTQQVEPASTRAAVLRTEPSLAEAQTLVQTGGEESREANEAATRILPPDSAAAATRAQHAATQRRTTSTQLDRDTLEDERALETLSASGLTRVGSILGTPLYMSPEQCRSEPLDSRTDIYSLGVIAYQMLAGAPPFSGEVQEVIRQHIEIPPPALKQKRKNIPKRLERVVMSAVAKEPADRPATAAGFASSLRAQSEGTGALLRRAFSLYSEHFPKFFRISLLATLPIIVLNALDIINLVLNRKGVVPQQPSKIASTVITVLTPFGAFVATSIVAGVTIRLVNQLFLAPLRPIELRLALAALRKRIRALMMTTLMIGIGSILLLPLLIVPGVLFYVNSSLSAPVVMMENLKGRAAIRRSKQLVSRARRTVFATVCLSFLIPVFFNSITGTFFIAIFREAEQQKALAPKMTQLITQILNVLIVPLISTLTSLLYIKTRAAGGESLHEAFLGLEQEEQPMKKWELRIRERMQSTPGSGSR